MIYQCPGHLEVLFLGYVFWAACFAWSLEGLSGVLPRAQLFVTSLVLSIGDFGYFKSGSDLGLNNDLNVFSNT